MPARRSRTEQWRDQLQSLQERNGAIEISLPGANHHGPGPENHDDDPKSLIWRVRILNVSRNEIVVEQPMMLRQRIELDPGIELVGVIASGPNRWMFSTRNLGPTPIRIAGGRDVPGLRLAMPDKVERCQRRAFYRVAAVGLTLPKVDCYPLLDLKSAEDAEAANRILIFERAARIEAGETPPPVAAPTLPRVGPGVAGTLVNIGGGGAGVLFEPGESSGVERSRLFWVMVHLDPQIPAPLGVTARLVHTHTDPFQRLYAGLAFEFGVGRAHEQFVVNQICKYIADLQRDQARRVAV